MKIAFVGKGGSGKSTVSSQFFTYLTNKNKKAAFIDADLNIHAPELIGVEVKKEHHLSKKSNARKIRGYLKGSSNKISSVDHFYATTPPSSGVNLFEITPNNTIIKDYFTQHGTGYVGAVGTYEKDAVGISCYHDSLSILENVISFSNIAKDEYLVVDMVAGIDAFANSLYMQFDALVLIVEPTREGIDVYKQYTELAHHAGINDRLRVIGNKVDDKGDEQFLADNIDSGHLLGFFYIDKHIKKLRQQGEVLPLVLDDSVFTKLVDETKNIYREPREYLALLNDLHMKFVKQEYVVNAVGDITNQIDKEYQYK